MNNLGSVVISKFEPSQTNVVWIDVSTLHIKVKAYINGKWLQIPSSYLHNILIDNSGQEISQTWKLKSGENWFSSYININMNDLLTALKQSFPEANTMMIKSYNNGSTSYYKKTHSWRGPLSQIDVTKDMYIIVVPENCEFTLTGTMINPNGISRELMGFKWVAFPYSVPHDIEYVVKYFDPQEDDFIKDHNDKKSVYKNGEWQGNLTTLYPGYGFTYYTKQDNQRTVYFNSSNLVVQDIAVSDGNMYIQTLGIDSLPTENSQNLITSGAVYAALNNL